MSDIGKSILDELYPPPPPAYMTSPIAFAEEVYGLPTAERSPVWQRARHIEIMEEAILRTIKKDSGRLCIAVSVRHGKALDVDTPIATPHGWTRMGDLRPGDIVYDEHGDECRVVHAFEPYDTDDVWEITFDDGTTLVADGEHEWRAFTPADTRKLRAAAKKEGTRLAMWPWAWHEDATALKTAELEPKFRIPTVAGGIQGRPTELPVDPYLLGLWLGDGSSRGNNISCHEDVAAWIFGAVERAGFEASYYRDGVRVAPTGKGNTSPFGQALRDLGVWGNKHVPPAYLRASREQRLALLAGLMDSDGEISHSSDTTGKVCFTNTNPNLAEGAMELFASLGAKPSINSRPARYNGRETGTTAYRVRCSPPFNPFKLPQKAVVWSNTKLPLRRTARSIRSIDRVQGRRVRCIAVDSPSNLYLAGKGMVPTHNSMFGSRIVPAWYLGTNPNKRWMLAGHEADFSSRHGRATRDLLTEGGPKLFGVRVDPGSQAANRWDIEGHEGGMLTLGVGGSPIGRGGDVVSVDDPYRNYDDAMNPRVRKNVLEWWTGTMVSRIEPGGSVIIIMARWHRDDLIGVVTREAPDEWEVLEIPAMCTDPDADPLGRALGEAAWPERYPVPAILKARDDMSLSVGQGVFDAQFQQDPHAAEGGVFDPDSWAYYDELPPVERWCRGWDLAASDGKGDWTVGVLLGKVKESQRWVVADVRRERLGPDKMHALLLRTAHDDRERYGQVTIDIPQDPAQAGKDQAQQLVAMLAGFSVQKTPTTAAKTVKASGAASQQRAGNLWLPASQRALTAGGGQGAVKWVGPLVSETEQFPDGSFDDQVDALSSAFNRVAKPGSRLIL